MALLSRVMGVSTRPIGLLCGDGHSLTALFQFQWPVAEVHVFLAEVRAAFKDRSIHSYSPV